MEEVWEFDHPIYTFFGNFRNAENWATPGTLVGCTVRSLRADPNLLRAVGSLYTQSESMRTSGAQSSTFSVSFGLLELPFVLRFVRYIHGQDLKA